MKQFSTERLAAALAPHRVETVAAYVGVSERTIRNWIDGKSEPRATQLHMLAAFTGKKISHFYQEVA